MINTFHTSFTPPPVPPRQGHRGAMPPTNTPLVKFLSVMLLLLMILTFGGFLYLFHRLSVMPYGYSDLYFAKQCEESSLRPEDMDYCKKVVENAFKGGRVAALTGRGFSTTSLARLVLPWNTPVTTTADQRDTLIWDEEHSLVKEIRLNSKGIVTIDYPGYYFVYSQVTFSKGHMKVPLRQVIWTRKSKNDGKDKEDWEKLLVSYCSLPQSSSVPDLCTASHTGVFELEKNQQLFLNVTGRDLVNAESSTFGLFKLQD
ncbi:CD40 ligand [Colossoma macropomum]|uniref:CD40 ligand n=1 Tax=Colossoma macropomum TaxID=42526 RepID=UPI00186402FD|nr:CD40 ligand [Colossoma macropomum]